MTDVGWIELDHIIMLKSVDNSQIKERWYNNISFQHLFTKHE